MLYSAACLDWTPIESIVIETKTDDVPRWCSTAKCISIQNPNQNQAGTNAQWRLSVDLSHSEELSLFTLSSLCSGGPTLLVTILTVSFEPIGKKMASTENL